jgi:membrane-bound serine protease (ClpP class)
MLGAILMAMVDIYPPVPKIPGSFRIKVPVQEMIRNFTLAVAGSTLAIVVLSRYLPRTPLYRRLVSESASGENSVSAQIQIHSTRLGEVGVTLSPLRPGGKAQFGGEVLDVLSQGELVPKGTRVKIVGYSGADAIVEAEPQGSR